MSIYKGHGLVLIKIMNLFLKFSDLLPDERLQDERRGTFLKLQLFVVQRLGVGTTFGSPLTK